MTTHQHHNEPTPPGQAQTVWIPEDLRPPASRLWELADNSTWGYGTRLGKAWKLWRWPANLGGWYFLRQSHRRDRVACYRNAHLHVDELTERTAARVGHVVPWLVLVLVAAGLVLTDIVDFLVTGAPVSADIIMIGVLLAFLLFVVPLATEMLNTGWSSARRAPLRSLGMEKVAAEGHHGPVGFGDGLVSRPRGDGSVLRRLWLEHCDTAGIAVVIDARDEGLAKIYANRHGFRWVGEDKLLMYRLPYQSSRQQPET